MVEGVDMTRILVVEDDQDTIDLYRILFQQLGYVVYFSLSLRLKNPARAASI